MAKRNASYDPLWDHKSLDIDIVEKMKLILSFLEQLHYFKYKDKYLSSSSTVVSLVSLPLRMRGVWWINELVS